MATSTRRRTLVPLVAGFCFVLLGLATMLIVWSSKPELHRTILDVEVAPLGAALDLEPREVASEMASIITSDEAAARLVADRGLGARPDIDTLRLEDGRILRIRWDENTSVDRTGALTDAAVDAIGIIGDRRLRGIDSNIAIHEDRLASEQQRLDELFEQIGTEDPTAEIESLTAEIETKQAERADLLGQISDVQAGLDVDTDEITPEEREELVARREGLEEQLATLDGTVLPLVERAELLTASTRDLDGFRRAVAVTEGDLDELRATRETVADGITEAVDSLPQPEALAPFSAKAPSNQGLLLMALGGIAALAGLWLLVAAVIRSRATSWGDRVDDGADTDQDIFGDPVPGADSDPNRSDEMIADGTAEVSDRVDDDAGPPESPSPSVREILSNPSIADGSVAAEANHDLGLGELGHLDLGLDVADEAAPEPDAAPEPEPERVVDTIDDAEPEPETEAVVDTIDEPEPEHEPEAEPVVDTIDEPEPEPIIDEADDPVGFDGGSSPDPDETDVGEPGDDVRLDRLVARVRRLMEE